MPGSGSRAGLGRFQFWGGWRRAGICFYQTGSAPFLPSQPSIPSPSPPRSHSGVLPFFPGSFLGEAVSFSLPGSDSPDPAPAAPARGDRHPDARSRTKLIPMPWLTLWGQQRWLWEQPKRQGSMEQRLPALLRARGSAPAASTQPSPWARSVLAPCPSQRAKPPWARLPVTVGRPQPLTRADAAQLEGTVHVLQPRSTLQRDLLSWLERAEKPRCLMPHSSPTRIISSYFHGKACHFLLCVFIPSLQSCGTPAILGAHYSLSANPLKPQHSLQKG